MRGEERGGDLVPAAQLLLPVRLPSSPQGPVAPGSSREQQSCRRGWWHTQSLGLCAAAGTWSSEIQAPVPVYSPGPQAQGTGRLWGRRQEQDKPRAKYGHRKRSQQPPPWCLPHSWLPQPPLPSHTSSTLPLRLQTFPASAGPSSGFQD